MTRSLSAWLVSILALAGCNGAPVTSSDASDTPTGLDGARDAGLDGTNSNESGTDAGYDAGPRGDAVIPSGHPRILLGDPVRRARLVDALGAARPAAMRFRAMVDAEMAGTSHYAFEPWFAALLGQLTGQANYCQFAVARTDADVAAEEALIDAGQRADVSGDSYLYVGGRIGGLSRVYDWCYDTLTDTQRNRWRTYANQAIWNVWHPDTAMWGGTMYPWSGWSVDNPSNNYYYSFLEATMLFGLAANGEHPEAANWVRWFRDTKIQNELVPAFTADLAGGGSREGTGYGTAMMRLFELYDLWEASTGERIHDLTPHTRASLTHFLHVIVPTRDRIAPVGDQARDSTASLFDYHRNYVQILVSLYRSEPVAGMARWTMNHSSVPEMSQQFMYVYDFLYENGDVTETEPTPLRTAYYGPGTGQMYFRSSWDTDATWVQLIGGPYTESHAHHDQGSLMIYRGEWLAYDQDVNSQSGIRQEEEMHNLVRVMRGGSVVPQHEGQSSHVLALHDTPSYAYAAVDVTPIYDGDPAVTLHQRELVYLRPDAVVVFDRIDAAADTTRVWHLNTPVVPTIAGDTATIANGSNTLVVRRILPTDATTTVFDWTTDSDMHVGRRIDTTHHEATGSSRFLHVLSVDGAVTNAAESSASGQSGVTITFADGTSAVVRFATSAPGGTLERRDGSGATIESATLAAGVYPLSELAP